MLSSLASDEPFGSAATPAPAESAGAAGAAEDVDALLMVRVSQGDEGAFKTLVEKNQNYLLNFFARMGAYSDCEDLAQDTFVRLYRYRDRYQPTARFTTFLHVLARRVWADRGRKVLRREKLATRLEAEARIIPFTSDHGPATADIDAALAKLSSKLRDVIVLNIYQGLRYQEVAEVLDIPLGTVKSRLNLALNALREYLHEP
jgi:RNA polymerase sigma-70 factor (ECF subfamily)